MVTVAAANLIKNVVRLDMVQSGVPDGVQSLSIEMLGNDNFGVTVTLNDGTHVTVSTSTSGRALNGRVLQLRNKRTRAIAYSTVFMDLVLNKAMGQTLSANGHDTIRTVSVLDLGLAAARDGGIRP